MFIDGNFFEISVCVATSMILVQYWIYLDESDHTSIIISLIFLLVLVAYLVYLSYFICFKSGQLAEMNRGELEKRNIKRTKEQTHEQLLAFIVLKSAKND